MKLAKPLSIFFALIFWTHFIYSASSCKEIHSSQTTASPQSLEGLERMVAQLDGFLSSNSVNRENFEIDLKRIFQDFLASETLLGQPWSAFHLELTRNTLFSGLSRHSELLLDLIWAYFLGEIDRPQVEPTEPQERVRQVLLEQQESELVSPAQVTEHVQLMREMILKVFESSQSRPKNKSELFRFLTAPRLQRLHLLALDHLEFQMDQESQEIFVSSFFRAIQPESWLISVKRRKDLAQIRLFAKSSLGKKFLNWVQSEAFLLPQLWTFEAQVLQGLPHEEVEPYLRSSQHWIARSVNRSDKGQLFLHFWLERLQPIGADRWELWSLNHDQVGRVVEYLKVYPVSVLVEADLGEAISIAVRRALSYQHRWILYKSREHYSQRLLADPMLANFNLNGAVSNSRSFFGRTALDIVLAPDQVESKFDYIYPWVEELISLGAKVSLFDSDWDLIHSFVQVYALGKPEFRKFLNTFLRAGGDLHSSSPRFASFAYVGLEVPYTGNSLKSTLLILTEYFNKEDRVAFLNRRDALGATFLHESLKAVIQETLTYPDGRDDLKRQILRSYFPVWKAFLMMGADLNQKNNFGESFCSLLAGQTLLRKTDLAILGCSK